jgi:hypothetical protein
MIILIIILLFVTFVVFNLLKTGLFYVQAKLIKVDPSENQDFSPSDLFYAQGEKLLRKKAYSTVNMNFETTFFDDSDMKKAYFLLIIYRKRTKEILLSARYYSDNEIIKKVISGEKSDSNYLIENKILPALQKGDVVLIDRMSANTKLHFYRKYRNIIHLHFYLALYLNNKEALICAMARSSKKESLLTKYVKIGLEIIGKTQHNGATHWILIGDFKTCYKRLKQNLIFNILFVLKKNL